MNNKLHYRHAAEGRHPVRAKRIYKYRLTAMARPRPSAGWYVVNYSVGYKHSDYDPETLDRDKMDIKPIKTEKDYQAALKRLEKLMDAKKNTAKGDELDKLATLVEAYEQMNII